MHFKAILPNPFAAVAAKSKFVKWLQSSCPHHPALPGLHGALVGSPCVNSRPKAIPPGTRVILPYHPVWADAGLSKVARNVHNRFSKSLDVIGSLDFSVGICWKLAGPHLVSRLASMNQSKIKQTMSRED